MYQVEKILKQRQLNGEHHFLIKWLGFSHSQNTWEPVANIIYKCSITQFYKQHPPAKRFDKDPDYQPQMAAFETDDFPQVNQVITEFSHKITCHGTDGVSRASCYRIRLLEEPPSLYVTDNELSQECMQLLPQNTEVVLALRPLTSE